MSQIFNLPDVGEGLTEAEILSWKVTEGDTVEINDVLVEIETAKSVVELPSPYAGTVEKLMAKEGQTVEVDSPIIAISGGTSPATPVKDAAPAAAEATGSAEKKQSEAGADDVHQAALVGSGPKADPVKRRARKRPATAVTAPAEPAAPAPSAPESGNQRTLAKPPVRKAAQDMGINLQDVTPTGEHGQVTKKDLLNYAAHVSLPTPEPKGTSPSRFWQAGAQVDENRIERIPVKGVRKATAAAMVKSSFSAPHVSIFVDVDASRTMEFVKRLKASPQFEGIKVTPLLILAKAVIWAAARNPQVNATWTDSEIQIKHFMNLGIAAATPRGLMVPNIKNAHELNLRELAIALNELTARAREGKTQPAEMSNGTMTITNIGSLGIDTGTPIINPGEAAIIAFGTIKQKPWVVSGEVIPRWVTTLGGSFDHRILDGDLSARFLADVASILEEPALLLDM